MIPAHVDNLAPVATQRDQLLNLFAEHGNVLTLGGDGYIITCQIRKPASANLYTLTPPVKFEDGQGVML